MHTAVPAKGNVVSRELDSRETGQEILERVEYSDDDDDDGECDSDSDSHHIDC